MAEAAAALEAESVARPLLASVGPPSTSGPEVKDLLRPRLGVDYLCDEGNKPREMDDSKRRTKASKAVWLEMGLPGGCKLGACVMERGAGARVGLLALSGDDP